MRTIYAPARSEIEIKRSRFIASLARTDSEEAAREFIAQIRRKSHPPSSPAVSPPPATTAPLLSFTKILGLILPAVATMENRRELPEARCSKS